MGACGRPRALILTLNGLDHDRRVLNEAQSLTAAGFDVTRVGIVAREGQPAFESGPSGSIIRMSPNWYPPVPAAAASAAAGGGGQAGSLRQWSWKLRLLGAIRRALPRTMKSADRMRNVRRWTSEIVTACADLGPDVIIACDFDTLPAGYRLKRDSGAACLVYDAHELWVDQECHTYLTRVFRWLALSLEGRFARRADLCTTVGHGLARTLALRHRIVSPLVVFNGPDQVLDPVPRAEGPLRLYFQGSYSPGRGIAEAITAMPALKGRATLTLQGFGVLEGSLRQLAADLELDDGTVGFVPPCRPGEVVQASAAYDVGLVSVQPVCLNNVLSMPNKVFTYLGGGAAILATEQTPEIAALARDYGCGVVAESWDAAGILRAVEPLLSDRAHVERLRAAAREACDAFRWNLQFAPVERAVGRILAAASAGSRRPRACILRTGPLVYDKRTQQVARLLVKRGLDVRLICVADSSRQWESPDGYSVTEIWPGSASTHPVWVVRVAANMARMWRQHRMMLRLARAVSADVYHCMNIDTLLQGWLASRRGGVYIYDSREHFRTTGTVRSRIRRYWMLKERLLIPRAAAVLTVSDPIAEELATRYRIALPTVVHNGSVGMVEAPQPAHMPLRILHLGRFYRDRHLVDLLKALTPLRGRVVLTLQGWGDGEAELRRAIELAGLEGLVEIHPPVAPEDVIEAAARHDVGLVTIRPVNDSHDWAAPNKLFEYIGAGLAVLTTNLSFAGQLVESAGCGLVFDPPDAQGLLPALEHLAAWPDIVSDMKRRAVEVAPLYTWDAQAPALYELYDRVLDGVR